MTKEILLEVDLSKADLYNIDSKETKLIGANLNKATLFRADLTNENLEFAELRFAVLQYKDLSSINLRGAVLYGVDLNIIKSNECTLWINAKYCLHPLYETKFPNEFDPKNIV